MSVYFPMFINLENKRVLVVGAGNIATRRIKALIRFNAKVKVVAQLFSPDMKEIGEKFDIDMINRGFIPEDLDDIDIAVIATDNTTLNDEISEMCAERGIMKNVASDQTKCDFLFPAIVLTDEAVIAINTGGKSPATSKRIKEQIQKLLKK